MKEAKFYLEVRKDKTGKIIKENVPVRLSYFFSGNRLEYYTGIRISNTKNWINSGNRYVQANEPQAGRINQRLKEMKNYVESLHDTAIALTQTPTIEHLKDKLDQRFKGKSTDPDQVLVKDAFQEYLDY